MTERVEATGTGGKQVSDTSRKITCIENFQGRWVLWDDYAALQAENEALRGQAATVQSQRPGINGEKEGETIDMTRPGDTIHET